MKKIFIFLFIFPLFVLAVENGSFPAGRHATEGVDPNTAIKADGAGNLKKGVATPECCEAIQTAGEATLGNGKGVLNSVQNKPTTPDTQTPVETGN